MKHWPSAPARLACLLVLVAGVATAPVQARRGQLLALVIPCVALALTRPRLRWLASRLGAASFGLAALIVPFVLLGPAARALPISLRATSATLIAIAIASSIELSELPRALRSLAVPEVLASTVHAMLWQLGHVSDEARRLLLARRLRGARNGFGPEVLALLLVRTAARAERVDLALRLRGATGALTARSRFRPSDAPILGLAAGAALALHVLG